MSTRFPRLPRTYLFWAGILSYLVFLFVNAALGIPVVINVNGKLEKHRTTSLKVRGALAESGVSIEEVVEVRPEINEYIDGRPIEVKKKDYFTLQNRILSVEERIRRGFPSFLSFTLNLGNYKPPAIDFRSNYSEYRQLKKRAASAISKNISRTVAMNVPAKKHSLTSRGNNRKGNPENSSSGNVSGKSLSVLASAYAPGAGAGFITATGKKARRGIIAVDPRVIPLGTKLYVPGYGHGIAADTGGAIKGNRIDLCFDTRTEAINWGKRRVVIYIVR